MLTHNEYKQAAMKTATYPKEQAELYLDLGVHGEAGEVCDKFKKLIRDKGWVPGKDIAPEDRREILLELGDVMWYLANISVVFGIPLNFSHIDRATGERMGKDDAPMQRYEDVLNATTMIKHVRTLHSEIDHGRNHIAWVMYAIAIIAQCLGSSLEEVCRMNIEKLADRQQRDALGGSGDHR